MGTIAWTSQGGLVSSKGGTITGELTPSGGLSYWGTTHYIGFPGGGTYAGTDAVKKGYLKITMPQSWNATMMKFKVSIYNYAGNQSCDYFIGGYNFPDSTNSRWVNCTAYSIGDGNDTTISNLPVYFFHDGSKCAVAIGAASTTWDYPQVAISDLTVGYSGGTYANWKSGWSISFVTSISNIDHTFENPYVGTGRYALSSHTHSNYLTTTGTAAAAIKLATARTISLSGDVTGSTSFNGTANVTIAATVANDSHSHSNSTITSLDASKISSGTLAAARLPSSGVTAGSYGPTANVTGTNGTTINVPQITVDKYGRVTSVTNRIYTSKDTNTTYSLSSFGITATAAELNKLDGCTATTTELNYVDGVTSNIQTQLNDKAASSHTHSYLPLSGGTLTGATTINANYFKYKNTNCAAFTTASSATAANGNARVYFINTSSECMGELLTGLDSTNYSFMRMEAVRQNGSASYYNTINLKLGPTGQYLYSVTSPAAFRNSLGLGNTSGALPVANGGTGATARGGSITSSGLLYKIGVQAGTGAAPSSGSAGMIYIQYS